MKDLEKQIYELETSLLDPEVRVSYEALNELLADEFTEFGSLGLVYNKKDILERLPKNTDKVKYILSNFSIKQLSENIILSTFKTERTINDTDIVISLRSSIWKKEEDRWRLCFHQGTPIK